MIPAHPEALQFEQETPQEIARSLRMWCSLAVLSGSATLAGIIAAVRAFA